MPRIIKSRDGEVQFPEQTEFQKLLLNVKTLSGSAPAGKVELAPYTDGTLRMLDENGVVTNLSEGSGTVDGPVPLSLRTLEVDGVEGDVVGTTDSQILTNKKYNGGAASDINKTVLPSGTTSQLDLLTTEEGSIYYDTDKKIPVYDNGTSLIEVGGSAGQLVLDMVYTGPTSNVAANTYLAFNTWTVNLDLLNTYYTGTREIRFKPTITGTYSFEFRGYMRYTNSNYMSYQVTLEKQFSDGNGPHLKYYSASDNKATTISNYYNGATLDQYGILTDLLSRDQQVYFKVQEIGSYNMDITALELKAYKIG